MSFSTSSVRPFLEDLWHQIQNDPSQFVGTVLTLVIIITVRLLVRRYLVNKQVGQVVGKLKSIHVYPIKSCKGFEVSKWRINKYGLEHDREWMVIDSETNRFQTQRQIPKMALITPSFKEENSRQWLCVDFPGMDTLKIKMTAAPGKEEAVQEVGIWKDQTSGIDQGDEAAAWFQKALGKPTLRLVRVPLNNSRRVPQKYELQKGLNFVNYADAFPFLLISESSLGDLNKRLEQKQSKPLPMNRFRPNLVVSGTDAFAEDHFKRFQIGQVTFSGVKKCTRCKLTTVDQQVGDFAGDEPLNTLKTYRQGLLEGKDEVCFGENLIHMGTGQIEVGQPLTLFETKK